MSNETMLFIGYALAVVSYGGYWVFLKRKTSKLEQALTSTASYTK